MKNKNISLTVILSAAKKLWPQILRSLRQLRMTFLVLFFFTAFPLFAGDAPTHSSSLDQKLKNHETTFYRDFFDQIVYYPISKPLRWDRIASRLIGREALNINRFDEIPDSSFFENRIGRKEMSLSELKSGPNEENPEMKGPWTITKGKDDGYQVGFFIQDAKGDRYLLKFDPTDWPEMSTSAEVIASKFFHAFGYHVPQYSLVHFKAEIFKLDPNATYYTEQGFKKSLDQAAFEKLLQKATLMKNGLYRASASRILSGKLKGYTPFEGRRKGDPEDLIPHEDRREMRAMRVFGSWMNHYDLRVHNTMDVVLEKDGKEFVKHYWIDFGSTFGSAGSHVKYPAAVHENVVDWRAIGGALFIFKTDYKDWEKRWDYNERQVAYPAIGYFDNLRFHPARWQPQLPHEVFNRVSEADGFWAAKIISKFSDEMIRELVKTGEISDSEAENYLSKVIIERRDIVLRHWFSKVVPFDKIKFLNGTLQFEDLALRHQFDDGNNVRYRYKVDKGPWQEFTGNSLPLEFDPSINKHTLFIQKKITPGSKWNKLPIRIHFEKLNSDQTFQISGIERGRI